MATQDPLNVTISIRCNRCLTWSGDDTNFCHKCGEQLRPLPEELVHQESGQAAA